MGGWRFDKYRMLSKRSPRLESREGTPLFVVLKKIAEILTAGRPLKFDRQCRAKHRRHVTSRLSLTSNSLLLSYSSLVASSKSH